MKNFDYSKASRPGDYGYAGKKYSKCCPFRDKERPKFSRHDLKAQPMTDPFAELL